MFLQGYQCYQKTFSRRYLHANLGSRSALIGEVLEEGSDKYFMVDVRFEEEEQKAANFSDLKPAQQYRIALIYKALAMATSWLDKVTDQSIEEVTDTVFKLAEADLANDEYKEIPELVKRLDKDGLLI